jgi:hypothetical protein
MAVLGIILIVMLREAFVSGMALVALAVLMGFLFAPFLFFMWAPPILWSSPVLYDHLKRKQSRDR